MEFIEECKGEVTITCQPAIMKRMRVVVVVGVLRVPCESPACPMRHACVPCVRTASCVWCCCVGGRLLAQALIMVCLIHIFKHQQTLLSPLTPFSK